MPEWEKLYVEAKVAVERARLAIDDVAGWSGASGNWPLQEASGRIREAHEAFTRDVMVLSYAGDVERLTHAITKAHEYLTQAEGCSIVSAVDILGAAMGRPRV